MTSTEADIFLRSVLADPAEPLRRLVFADWLEETGSRSNIAWAKYLRLAEEVDRLPLDDPQRTKRIILRERLGSLIQAKLRLKADVYTADPEAFRLLLPPRCLLLDLDGYSPPADALEALPEAVAREMRVVPLLLRDRTLLTASGVSLDAEDRQALRFILNYEIEPVLILEDQVVSAIDRIYSEVVENDCDSLTFSFTPPPLGEVGPIPRIIEMILNDAAAERIRDIRIQRAGPRVDVRFVRGQAEPLWGGFPVKVHLPLVEYVRRLAGLPTDFANAEQSGIFHYPLPHCTLDVALRIFLSRSGPQMHLTILPSLYEAPSSANLVA